MGGGRPTLAAASVAKSLSQCIAEFDLFQKIKKESAEKLGGFFGNVVAAIADDSAGDIVGNCPHHLFHHYAQTSITPDRQDWRFEALRRMRTILCDILEQRPIVGHPCTPSPRRRITTDIFVESDTIDRDGI